MIQRLGDVPDGTPHAVAGEDLAFVGRAQTYFKLSQWDNAIKDATSALAIKADNPNALITRADASYNKKDKAAYATLAADPSLHAILGTTCVATRLDAGHANNALPQRATALINCRIFPGVPRDEVRATLMRVIDNPKVSISVPGDGRSTATVGPPPLTPQVLGPIEKVTAEMWPGVPVVPILQAGGTDAPPLIAVGIPVYGVSGLFYDPDLGRLHGLNERIGVKSLMEGREFSYRLVKLYAEQKD